LGWATPAPSNPEINGYNLQGTEIQGFVQTVVNQEAYVRTDDGQEIRVQLGPQSYWDERGYYLPEGDYVRMEVWYDPYGYTDWYFAGEIWGPGFHFVLTNSYGVPYWVIARDDYYYSLGYRASCVSYMVWFDCPPMYFVYVILPPPPWYYTCYYGPRWRGHHTEWHRHGSDYGDRSGWDGRDGRGGRRTGYNGGPRGQRQENGGKYVPPRENDKWSSRDRQVPVNPPKVKPRSQPRQESVSEWQAPPATPKPRQSLLQNRPAKPQPRQEQKDQYRAPAQPPDRKLQPRKPEPRERPNHSPAVQPKPRDVKYQERSTKPQVRENRPPNGNVPRQYNSPQRSRQSSGSNDARRSSGSRGQERGNRRR